MSEGPSGAERDAGEVGGGTEEQDRDARSTEPPVDGPGAAEGNDDAGATSYDQPGGDEHGTS